MRPNPNQSILIFIVRVKMIIFHMIAEIAPTLTSLGLPPRFLDVLFLPPNLDVPVVDSRHVDLGSDALVPSEGEVRGGLLELRLE